MSKLAIPDVGAEDAPMVCLELNRVWVTYILTALATLDHVSVWEGTDDQIYDVLSELGDVMNILVNGN